MSTINDSDLILVNRSSTSYKCEISNWDADVQDTDTLLCERSNTSYKVTKANVDDINDTDNLLIERSNTSYKVSGEDFKAFVSPDTSVATAGNIYSVHVPYGATSLTTTAISCPVQVVNLCDGSGKLAAVGTDGNIYYRSTTSSSLTALNWGGTTGSFSSQDGNNKAIVFGYYWNNSTYKPCFILKNNGDIEGWLYPNTRIYVPSGVSGFDSNGPTFAFKRLFKFGSTNNIGAIAENGRVFVCYDATGTCCNVSITSRTWQEVTPTLPNSEIVVEAAAMQGSNNPGLIFLSNAGKLYAVSEASPNASMSIDGLPTTGSLASPVAVNSTHTFTSLDGGGSGTYFSVSALRDNGDMWTGAGGTATAGGNYQTANGKDPWGAVSQSSIGQTLRTCWWGYEYGCLVAPRSDKKFYSTLKDRSGYTMYPIYAPGTTTNLVGTTGQVNSCTGAPNYDGSYFIATT